MDTQRTAIITGIPHYVCRFYGQPIVAPYAPRKRVHLNNKNGNRFQTSGVKQPLTCVFMMEINKQFLHVAVN